MRTEPPAPRTLPAALFAASLGALVAANTLWNGFVYDDVQNTSATAGCATRAACARSSRRTSPASTPPTRRASTGR